jgi:hypothetical protein
MNKKISFYIISIFILVSYILISLSYKYYNQIQFSDHDEGYLIEQLALKLGIFDLTKSASSAATYGADFYYFKYFFLIINYLNLIDIIDVYRIKTFINAIFAIIGFFTIYKIFDLLKFSKIFYYLFPLSLISVPEIFTLTVSIKPDLNFLFMTLVLSYYFFLKSKIFNEKKYAYCFIIFLGLSLSIKAWAFPFIFLLFFDKFNYLKNITKKNRIFFGILISLFFFLLNFYIVGIKNFILLNSDFLSFYKENKNNIYLEVTVNVFKNYFYFLLFFINSLFIIYLNLIFYLKRYKNLLIKYSLFFFSWFILWYPYISDLSVLTKTIIEHSYATVLNKNSATYENYENVIAYSLYDLQNFKINFGIFLIFILSPIILYFNKIFLSNHLKNLNPLMFLCFISILFVNFIADYPNQYPAKTLYFIFITLFVFYLTNCFSNRKNIFRFLLIFFLTSYFITIFSDSSKYTNFMNYLKKNEKINYMLDVHFNKINLKNKNLYTCQATYPIDITRTKSINVIPKTSTECLSLEFVSKIKEGDLIYYRPFDKNTVTESKVLNLYYLYYADTHKIISRFGVIKDKKNLFFKKITK